MKASNVIPIRRKKAASNITDLTIAKIKNIPLAHRGANNKVKQIIYWDKNVKGFGLLTGLNSKTFIVQRSVNGREKRITIDRFGIITPDQARERAKQLLVEMGQGINPNERKAKAKAQGITLSDALEAYKTSRKNLSEKTKYETTRLFERYLKDWLNKPLTEITKDMVAKRHIEIAKKVKANPRFKDSPNFSGTSKATGVYAANGAFRALKTVYNHALAVNESLPPNPVKLLSTTRAWYPEEPRTAHIKPTDLKKWIAAIRRVRNEEQRDYAMLVLFTGLRRIEAATLEWQNVNLKERTLRIPVTKNKKPLDLPLSSYLVKLLTTRKKKCADSPWVFPANSASGHIAEPRSALEIAAKESGVNVTVHDLRRTFITIAESCDVPTYVFKAIVNHSTAGDVTGTHYIQMSTERMRPWMQKITDAIQLYV